MKIYVIEAGEYSNRHICAVTDNKESAENLRLLYTRKWEEAYISEWDTVQVPKKPDSYWHINVDFDGDVKSEMYYFTKDQEAEIDINQVNLEYRGYQINVIADDREQAYKIAFDKIAEYKYEHMEEVEAAVAEKRRWEARFAMNGMASSAFIW